MIKTTAITMRGKQAVIYVDVDRFPVGATIFNIDIDNKGRQAILFGGILPKNPIAVYKISPIKAKRKGKIYTYWLIGLHREFLLRNGLSKGDRVCVEYRKDRVVISKSDLPEKIKQVMKGDAVKAMLEVEKEYVNTPSPFMKALRGMK